MTSSFWEVFFRKLHVVRLVNKFCRRCNLTKIHDYILLIVFPLIPLQWVNTMKRSRSRLGWTTTYIDFLNVFRFTFPVPVTGSRAKLRLSCSLCHRKHKKFLARSFRSRKILSLTCGQVYYIQNTVVFCHPKPWVHELALDMNELFLQIQFSPQEG